MDSLISDFLGKALRFFMKDYQAENLNVEILKGRLSLTEAEFKPQFFQEMVLLPTSFELRQIKATGLSVELPSLTRYLNDPIVIAIETLDILVVEPEKVKPMPRYLRLLSQKKNQSENNNDNNTTISKMMKNVRFEVKKFQLSIRLLGYEGMNWRPEMFIVSQNIAMFVTNNLWQVVDLETSRDIDMTTQTETMYQVLELPTTKVQLKVNGVVDSIFDALCAHIRFTRHFDMTVGSGKITSVIIEFFFEEFKLDLNQSQLINLLEFLLACKVCFHRRLPDDMAGFAYDFTFKIFLKKPFFNSGNTKTPKVIISSEEKKSTPPSSPSKENTKSMRGFFVLLFWR
eukprot:TRINITY_DN7465_c0_g1_i1.p1 TRINITY_DN7465_c0_g1~~TRINITY_DN7465_c0_g1_i1.p1  ORF type:complete len:374 (-),score=84.52 TRINITY_DN7465_c0_g1_i1:17-1045(-)